MKFSSSVLPLLGLCFAGSVVSAVGRGNSHNHNKGNSQNNAQNTDQGPYSADEISATVSEGTRACINVCVRFLFDFADSSLTHDTVRIAHRISKK